MKEKTVVTIVIALGLALALSTLLTVTVYTKIMVDQAFERTDKTKLDLAAKGFTVVSVEMNTPSIIVTLETEAMLIQKAQELGTSTIYQTRRGLWVLNEQTTIGYVYSP